MGKTRGHGSKPKAYKGRKGPRAEGDEEGSSSEEEYEAPRGLGGQAATVGMLPPSDSEDEEEEAAGEKKEEKEEKPQKPKGQNRNAGKLPPSGSEDEEDGSDDESSDEAPEPAYLSAAAAPRKKKDDDAPDPEQIRKDMERLELIKQRREEDRLKRIRDEGWDRFAPVSETNKPPGHAVPVDHPSKA